MPYTQELNNEFQFRTARSSGPGGQNVNKVESKVELCWQVHKSQVLSDREKALVLDKLSKRINNEGELILSSQTVRSQLKNKELVIKRFYILLNAALKVQKKRKATRPTKASVKKRIDHKKKTSEIKKLRKRPDY